MGEGLRTAGKVIFSVLLAIFLILLIITFTIYQQTRYENIKDPVINLVSSTIVEKLDSNQLTDIHSTIQKKCKTSDSIEFPSSDIEINLPFKISPKSISCYELKNKSTEQVVKTISKAHFVDFYDNGLDNIEIDLISSYIKSPKQINQIMLTISTIIAIISLILIGLLILITKPRINSLKNLGVIFLIASIPTYYLYFFTPIPSNSQFYELSEIFMNSLATNQLFIVIIGIILLINGLIFISLATKKKYKKKS